MDLINPVGPSSSSGNYVVVPVEDDTPASISLDHKQFCWGCGLHVLVPDYASSFKCGWCGAITKEQSSKSDDNKWVRWRWSRDRFFVSIVVLFMAFFICAGIWAVYPVIFSVSYLYGVIHLTIAAILSLCTLSSFCIAAFQPAGSSPIVIWGSYPAVEKGALENYTFCHYCSKPKPPRAHHCRSCRMCVLDMDHHCPFIGNCVGAANHRSFVFFLIFTLLSTLYVAIMALFSVFSIWPPLNRRTLNRITELGEGNWTFQSLEDKFLDFLGSVLLLPIRGLVLVYLFMCSVSVGSGLTALLWQQLYYVYTGKTYLSRLSSGDNEDVTEKDCQNIMRFFGLPLGVTMYLPSFMKAQKSHDK